MCLCKQYKRYPQINHNFPLKNANTIHSFDITWKAKNSPACGPDKQQASLKKRTNCYASKSSKGKVKNFSNVQFLPFLWMLWIKKESQDRKTFTLVTQRTTQPIFCEVSLLIHNGKQWENTSSYYKTERWTKKMIFCFFFFFLWCFIHWFSRILLSNYVLLSNKRTAHVGNLLFFYLMFNDGSYGIRKQLQLLQCG